MNRPEAIFVSFLGGIAVLAGIAISGAGAGVPAPTEVSAPTATQRALFQQALETGPTPPAVGALIEDFQGQVAYTGFVKRALAKQLMSKAFLARAAIPDAEKGHPATILQDLQPHQVEQAVVATARELSGMVPPPNLRLEATRQNALSEKMVRQFAPGVRAQALAPTKNALTGEVLSPGLSRFDWRDSGWVVLHSGIVSRAKDQSTPSSCGCCWAFGTIAAFEGSLARTSLRLIDASEQNLLDCFGRKFGNSSQVPYSCGGGWWAFDQLINPGVAGERAYPYRGVQGPCNESVLTTYKALAWGYVLSQAEIPTTPDHVDAIKGALCRYGPIAATIFASDFRFASHDGRHPVSSFPSGQMASGPGGTPAFVDHAIVIVGWNNALNAWAIKNSWGEDWGNEGFGYVDYFSNNIGLGAAWVTPAPPTLAASAPVRAVGTLVPSIPPDERVPVQYAPTFLEPAPTALQPGGSR